MRSITKIVTSLAAFAMLGLAIPVSAQAGTARHAAAEIAAFFEFQAPPGWSGPFVIKLTDPAKIQHARDLLSGATTDRPHVHGRIVKRPAPYNPAWSFHYEPSTIDFFDYAIEVCDATTQYVEDHLDEAGGAFLPGLHWCPWSSRLIREVR